MSGCRSEQFVTAHVGSVTEGSTYGDSLIRLLGPRRQGDLDGGAHTVDDDIDRVGARQIPRQVGLNDQPRLHIGCTGKNHRQEQHNCHAPNRTTS